MRINFPIMLLLVCVALSRSQAAHNQGHKAHQQAEQTTFNAWCSSQSLPITRVPPGVAGGGNQGGDWTSYVNGQLFQGDQNSIRNNTLCRVRRVYRQNPDRMRMELRFNGTDSLLGFRWSHSLDFGVVNNPQPAYQDSPVFNFSIYDQQTKIVVSRVACTKYDGNGTPSESLTMQDINRAFGENLQRGP